MKKLILGVATLMAVCFTSCEDSDNDNVYTETFDNITLVNGLAQNDSTSGSIEADDLAITCAWSTSEWGTYGSGFSVSDHSDVTTAGYTNPYSCIAGSGAAASSNFAVCYGGSDSIKFNTPVDMESVMLCNNTYAYLSMLNGDAFAKKFNSDDEDYFRLTLYIYGEANALLGTKDFYLADFRDDAAYIVNEWTKLDLDGFNDVSFITFSYESTDTSSYGGYNTPTYFCIDNIEYTK